MSNPWVKALCIVAADAVSIWLLTFTCTGGPPACGGF
jgi:hypothetical protein